MCWQWCSRAGDHMAARPERRAPDRSRQQAESGAAPERVAASAAAQIRHGDHDGFGPQRGHPSAQLDPNAIDPRHGSIPGALDSRHGSTPETARPSPRLDPRSASTLGTARPSRRLGPRRGSVLGLRHVHCDHWVVVDYAQSTRTEPGALFRRRCGTSPAPRIGNWTLPARCAQCLVSSVGWLVCR